jgi:hypothetical protein
MDFAFETYETAVPSFLSTYENRPYGVVGTKVVQLHDHTQYLDLEQYEIDCSEQTGYFNFGEFTEVKIGNIIVHGELTEGTGYTTVRITFPEDGTYVEEDILLDDTGVKIPVNRWAKQVQFTSSSTAKDEINIKKIDIEVLNSRIY